jgi:tetratricopeptide (TPR) repeat protein
MSENEQNCLNYPDSLCLLESASAITASMSDNVAHAEASAVIAKGQFELGNNKAMLDTISDIRILVLQFNALFEQNQIAQRLQQPTTDLLALATAITNDIQQQDDKVAALLLISILYYENQQSDIAEQHLQQGITLAIDSTAQGKTSVDIQFFNRILPKLMKFTNSNTIKELIALQTNPALQITAQANYIILLQKNNPVQAEQLIEPLLTRWHSLKDAQQHKIAQTAIIKLLINFDRLKQARQLRRQQTDIIAKVSVGSMIIQQLTIDTNEHNIIEAKQELVRLLQDVRLFAVPDIPVNALPHIKQQATQDDFNLASLRAQAIADVALGLAELGQLKEAVHFAVQIQHIMGHIQGYTLTKLAKQYAQQNDINNALLTMESIHRPVNRAACLAEISAQVAKNGDLNRAIAIASRINRRSWHDIAFSEISILQAKQNDIQTSMKTLDSIQRSYSTVYAMTEIALTLHANQNKR